jgi:hypothetical protein
MVAAYLKRAADSRLVGLKPAASRWPFLPLFFSPSLVDRLTGRRIEDERCRLVPGAIGSSVEVEHAQN